ncbi:MAG: hypothetical protein WCO00_14285 [Rhodospirillaceae bacterium]
MTHNDEANDQKFRYMRGKIRETIFCLIIGEGDVRERLLLAFKGNSFISEHDLPAHLQDDWRWVISQMTRFEITDTYDCDIRRGSYELTMNRIRNSTGRKIAERILKIAISMNCFSDIGFDVIDLQK